MGSVAVTVGAVRLRTWACLSSSLLGVLCTLVQRRLPGGRGVLSIAKSGGDPGAVSGRGTLTAKAKINSAEVLCKLQVVLEDGSLKG